MNIQTILMLVASAVIAFVAVNWAYFKILKIAKDKNLVDNPDARKLQKTPIPVIGGIASFVGVTAGMLTVLGLVAFGNSSLSCSMRPRRETRCSLVQTCRRHQT